MSYLQLIALLGFVFFIVATAKTIDWRDFARNKQLQHLVFGSLASVCFLWSFRAGIFAGLDVHFMWLAALTLLLGLRWSLLVASAALVVVTAMGYEFWSMLGINALLGVAVPVAITHVIFTWCFHRLPRNLFLYVFICAFIPGALIIAVKMLLLGGYYTVDGIYDWLTVKDNFVILIPLMLFPEGMLNGMTMTLLILYKPSWVYTFNDKFYLNDD